MEVRTVIYQETKNVTTKATIAFDKSACEKADLSNVDKQVVQKLVIPPTPMTKEAFDMGWNSTPEIQFESGRCIRQDYESAEGNFRLFEYAILD